MIYSFISWTDFPGLPYTVLTLLVKGVHEHHVVVTAVFPCVDKLHKGRLQCPLDLVDQWLLVLEV